MTVRLGEVETVEYQRDRALGITVYFNQAKGSASSADLRPEAVREMVRKACSIARHTARDEFAGLADAADMASVVPDLALYHPWDLSPEDAIEMARACEAAGLAVDKRLTNSEGASVSTHRGVRVYGNSHGFLAGYPSTSHSLSCVLLAQEGEDMQRDYWYSTARAPSGLEALEDIGRRAGERAVARLGARQVSTRKAPVLFAADLARGLFGHMVSAVQGSSQYRKSSFLLDAAGTQVLPSHRADAGAAASAAARWPARRSTPKACRRAIATWCATACCRAMCWAATRPASWGCTPPATRAASTTCWSAPAWARRISSSCWQPWAPACTSPS